MTTETNSTSTKALVIKGILSALATTLCTVFLLRSHFLVAHLLAYLFCIIGSLDVLMLTLVGYLLLKNLFAHRTTETAYANE